MSEVREFGNLLECGQKCCNGGRWKSRVQMFEMNILRWTALNHRRLHQKRYHFRRTSNFTLYERGKIRHIRSHHIVDRQIQKCYCKHELIPAMQGRIMSNNSASQKGKGTDHAIKAFRKGLSHAFKVCGGRNFYIFIYDFHDYFGSMEHSQIISTIGRDLPADSRDFLKSYIDIFGSSENARGVGIGGEPSQVIAISFPSLIDRAIACFPGTIDSGRYMDDGWAIAQTKDEINSIRDIFFTKANQLGLVVNEKRTRIYWMEKDVVTFLKKRTSVSPSGKIIMRLTRKNVNEELKRIHYQKKAYDAGEMPWEPVQQSFECWCSYARKYQSNKALLKVANHFSKAFDVPWDITTKLMNGGKKDGKTRSLERDRCAVGADPSRGAADGGDLGDEA